MSLLSILMMNDSFINYVNKTYDAYSEAGGVFVVRQRGDVNATPLPEDISSREAEPHVIFVQRMSKANSFDAWKESMPKFILSKALLKFVLFYWKKKSIDCRNKINDVQIIRWKYVQNINSTFYIYINLFKLCTNMSNWVIF